MRRIFFLIAFGFLANSSNGQSARLNDRWEEYYKKATVATFYSSSVLNGFDELTLAQLYTDSAEAYCLEDSNRKSKISDLRTEHTVSKYIASENINYMYPAFSLMAGYRPDFIIRDDAGELLVEALLEKVLDQNDPLNKGRFRDNTDYLLLSVEPYDSVYFTVASDYLGTTSGHYTIRYHEVKSILSPEAFRRYRNHTMSNEDWQVIADAYGVDQLIGLNIKDQGSIIPGLFYKGIYLNYYTSNDGFHYVNYYETFRVDKASAWSTSLYVVALLNFIFTYLGLFFLSTAKFSKGIGRGFRSGAFQISFFRNFEAYRDSVLVLLASLLSVIGATYLSSFVSPEINSYYGDPGVKVWLGFQLFVPFAFSIVGCYLALFKFPKIVVNSVLGYTRIIYVSFMVPLVLISYYEYQSELFPEALYKYLDFIPFIAALPVSYGVGKLLNNLFKGNTPSSLGWGLLITSLLLMLVAMYFELRQYFLLANLTYVINGIVTSTILYSSKSLLKDDGAGFISGAEEYNLSNPYTYISNAYLLGSPLNKMLDFIQGSSMKNILFLSGRSGIGKTRSLNELIQHFKKNHHNEFAVFVGDCNESKDGSTPMYEPFFEAFCLQGEICCSDLQNKGRLEKGFFTDRSQISKGLANILSTAGSLGPVDLSNVLSVEDNTSRSIKEIVNELLDILIDRFINHADTKKKVILVIDDYQKVDSSTTELLVAFINELHSRTKYHGKIKIIIIYSNDNQNVDNSSVASLKESINMEYNSLPEGEAFIEEYIEIDQGKFFDSVMSSKSFQVFGDSDAFSFNPLIKGHIEHISENNSKTITPSDFFSYLQALKSADILIFDGSIIRIVREPNEDEIGIQNSRATNILARFLELGENDRSLLESASSIGFKFDAGLLAQIWQVDVLSILNQLEKLEGSYVLDLNNQDNIYSFVDKVTHSVIFEFSQKRNGNEETRQLIIEYQKRIIKSIADNKDGSYLSSLDVDILVGATERCFKYSNIEFIHKHTNLLGLEACLKLSILGKRKKALELLQRLLSKCIDLSDSEIYKVSLVLRELTQVERKTIEFDFEFRNALFLDELHSLARQKANREFAQEDYLSNPYISVTIIILGGIMQHIKDQRRKNVDYKLNDDTQNLPYFKRLRLIEELISQQDDLNPYATLRIAFFRSNINGDQLSEYPILMKSAISQKYYSLAGEIARDYTLVPGVSLDQRRSAIFIALEIFDDKNQTHISLDHDTHELDSSQLMERVSNLIKSQTLDSRKAKDFNVLLSRIREYFYYDCKAYHEVVVISNLALSLSYRVGDDIGIERALSFKGASLYHIGDHEESLKVYTNYFEFLVRTTRKSEAFKYAVEGLLRNGNAVNDLSEFHRAKEELYEHLLYLGSAALHSNLDYSLFDPSQKLSDLFLVSEGLFVNEEFQQVEVQIEDKSLIIDVLNLLVGIAFSDGSIDENEMYDLKESAIALSYSLNLPKQFIIHYIPSICSEYDARNAEDRMQFFNKSCLHLKETYPKEKTLTLLSLCIDMSLADGQNTSGERKYIDLAHTIFTSKS